MFSFGGPAVDDFPAASGEDIASGRAEGDGAFHHRAYAGCGVAANQGTERSRDRYPAASHTCRRGGVSADQGVQNTFVCPFTAPPVRLSHATVVPEVG